MEFMEMERQLQDNVTKRLQAILEPEDLLFDEPMKDYTTFRVGGPAKWMAAPQDEQQLRVILKICRFHALFLDAAAICLSATKVLAV